MFHQKLNINRQTVAQTQSLRKINYLGVTSPISNEFCNPEDLEKSKALEETLKKFGLFESREELNHRMDVVGKINKIVEDCIHTITCRKNLFIDDDSEKINGKMFAFGSYRLGISSNGSDLDLLCIGPHHVDRSDFFSTFVELLQEQKAAKEIRAIEDAFVPVIKMTFDGIDVDMVFARLNLRSIPENLDLSNNKLLRNLDPICVRSLNGSRVTDAIMNLVPNKENFKVTLRAIKLYAKSQGIYSNALGYLGGVSWAILVARVCQLYPNASPATLTLKFFYILSQWTWPNPILLKFPEQNLLGFPVWDPRINVGDRYHLMPIITPVYPQQNSAFNVNFSSSKVIQDSLNKGLFITKQIMSRKLDWEALFEPVDFFSMYKHFITVEVGALTEEESLEWNSFIESKIRKLVRNVEMHPSINCVHINPENFKPYDANEPLKTVWLMGLKFQEGQSKQINLTDSIEQFCNLIHTKANQIRLYKKGMTIQVKHITRKELFKYLPGSILPKKKEKKIALNSRKRELQNKENLNVKRKC